MSYLEQRTEFLETLKENKASGEERVNITLNEYLHMFDEYFHMKEEVDRLEGVIRNTNNLITKLGIPADVIDKIDPSSVYVVSLKDDIAEATQYTVRFAVPGNPTDR